MEEQIVKLTDDQISLIEGYTMVTDATEKEAYFIPCWFERKERGIYAVHRLGRLPGWLKRLLAEMRRIDHREIDLQYTSDDMIEFAKQFLRSCQKDRVTKYQLEQFNKEKGYE